MNHPTDVRSVPSREFQITKQDLRIAQLVDVERAPVAAGKARLRVDLFAMTSNNITYAAMGEGIAGYWDFFACRDAVGQVRAEHAVHSGVEGFVAEKVLLGFPRRLVAWIGARIGIPVVERRIGRPVGGAVDEPVGCHRAFYDASSTLFTPRRLSGAPAILDCWARLAAGEARPQEGYVLSF